MTSRIGLLNWNASPTGALRWSILGPGNLKLKFCNGKSHRLGQSLFGMSAVTLMNTTTGMQLGILDGKPRMAGWHRNFGFPIPLPICLPWGGSEPQT